MIRKTHITTEEFDKDGNLVTRIVEITEETDEMKNHVTLSRTGECPYSYVFVTNK